MFMTCERFSVLIEIFESTHQMLIHTVFEMRPITHLIKILESTYQMLIHTVFEMTLITHTFQSTIYSPVTMQCQSLETI